MIDAVLGLRQNEKSDKGEHGNCNIRHTFVDLGNHACAPIILTTMAVTETKKEVPVASATKCSSHPDQVYNLLSFTQDPPRLAIPCMLFIISPNAGPKRV